MAAFRYLLAFLAGTTFLQAAERYTARMENGSLLDGPEVSPWHETAAQPILRGQPLLNPGDHVRWLRNNDLQLPVPPPAYVEFLGGDRLPGRVTAYRTGTESPFDRQPPHLVVAHAESLDWPATKRESVRVAVGWLRRVVWQSRALDRYQPGTVYLRDGRQRRFRSLRFQAGGARFLFEDKTEDVPFSQMAELHLPRVDPWEAYYQQLATLSPDGAARLLRIETTDGLIATASTERFAAKAHESNHPRHWLHAVQPAWSLDPLWARFSRIQLRRYWLPHLPALSDIEPSRAADPLAGGGHWTTRKDRNVQGGLLRAGGEDFGWGIGTHAPEVLTFPLPAEAKSFRTKLALDQIAGTGGCARALIHLGEATTTPAFRSDLLIGSKNITTPPPIALPAAAGAAAGSRVLTLVSDTAHRDRPPGADPLNIRDFVDWLEPEVELDRGELQRQIRHRSPAVIAAWDGWTAQSPKKGDDADLVRVSNRWDETDPRAPAFRLETAARLPGLVLSRLLKPGSRDNWLCLAVSRFGGPPSRIEVRISGTSAGSFDVPERIAKRGDPDPLVVSLRPYQGKDARIELVLPPEPSQKLDWRGIAILENRPGLLCLFEEQPDFAKRLTEGEGKAEVIATDRYLGTASLKVTPPGRSAARLLTTPIAIRESPKLGEYRYLRFAWKKKGGERIALQIGHEGRFGPLDAEATAPGKSFRFDAGDGEASFGAAVRLSGKIPSEWTDYTRDLYAEFGSFDLTGLSVAAVDGEYALFDHIYLARTLDDLQKIEVRPAGK